MSLDGLWSWLPPEKDSQMRLGPATWSFSWVRRWWVKESKQVAEKVLSSGLWGTSSRRVGIFKICSTLSDADRGAGWRVDQIMLSKTRDVSFWGHSVKKKEEKKKTNKYLFCASTYLDVILLDPQKKKNKKKPTKLGLGCLCLTGKKLRRQEVK